MQAGGHIIINTNSSGQLVMGLVGMTWNNKMVGKYIERVEIGRTGQCGGDTSNFN